MIAAKFMDMVVGVDIHWVLVPAPPSPAPIPTPLPHPFTGVIFDPAGLIVGALISAAASVVLGTPFQGPVLVNGMPAANTGTECTNKLVMPHFPTPPGVGWAPVPAGIKPPIPGKPPSPPMPSPVPTNDGIIITGSKTVMFSGTNAARLGSMVMSCGEPVRLPSSAVIAVPMGAPVLVGGPPALDFMAALMGMIRTQWVAGRLHSLVNRIRSARLRNLLHRAVCFLTGHPVDVMTGKVYTEFTDFELPGPIPCKFERVYYSTSTYDGPLGYGWHHSYDQHIRIESFGIVLRTGDGREVDFDFIGEGETTRDPIEVLELSRTYNGFKVWTKDRLNLYFEPRGRVDGTIPLVRIADLNNNEIILNYDSFGHLIEIIDSAGRVIRFTNDARGRITALNVPHPDVDGRIDAARFEYGERGDLAKAYDALGNAYHYKYKHHLLVQETNRNGLSFYFEYDGIDADAWCIRTWGDGGIYDHVITYDKEKHITAIENSLGAKTVYYGNQFGLVTKWIDGDGGETIYEWNDYCRKISQTDPSGATHKWNYDEKGNLVAYIDPMANITEYKANQDGDSIEVIDALGYSWRQNYDYKGAFIGTVDPLGFNWQIIRDDKGRILNVVDPISSRLDFKYDHNSNIIAESDWEGNFYNFEYNNWGQIVCRCNPLGEELRYIRDNLGRITKTIFPDGSKNLREYDSEGNLVLLQDANGNISRWRYLGMNKKAEYIDSIGRSVYYSYDTEERLVSMKNGKGEIYSYEYSPAGRLIRETDFAGYTNYYIYDSSGYCMKIISSNGKTIEIKRDLLGRVTNKLFADEEEFSFTYNEAGNITKAVSSDCIVSFEYDPVGRVIKESTPIAKDSTGEVSVESLYDALGNRILRRTSMGTETGFQYDRNGMLTGVFSGDQCQIAIKRDRIGRETEFQLKHKTKLYQKFTETGKLRSQSARCPHGTSVSANEDISDQCLLNREFSYDLVGNLKRVEDNLWGITKFEYNTINQLIKAEREKGISEYFDYDEVGSITKWLKSRPSNQSINFPGTQITEETAVYELGGRLLQKGDTIFEYDRHGYTTRKTVLIGQDNPYKWHYEWKPEGLLKRISDNHGNVWEFQYDAFGRRHSKISAEGKQRFLWDGDVVVHEIIDENAFSEWIFRPNSFIPLARNEKENWLLCVTDQIGTLTDMVNDDGKLLMSCQSGVWGDEIDIFPSDIQRPLSFQGQWVDNEFGLHWNMYRYYDPSCGRYLSPDPIGLQGGYHPYQYAFGGNTTTTIDPLGLMPWAWNSETGMGHHLVPRGKAGSAGLPNLATPRDTPTFFPTPYQPGMHEAIHRAQRPHIGRLQGPWAGTAEELLEASRRGLTELDHVIGELRIPSTGRVLASNVTPAQAFDRLMDWHRQQTGGGGCS